LGAQRQAAQALFVSGSEIATGLAIGQMIARLD
jgi:hypothetical protein